MQEHGDRPEPPDRTQTLDVPPYLVWFAVPPFIGAFVIADIDPNAGLALLACMTIMAVVLKVLIRVAR